jgi:hypothetical protein
MQKIPLYCYIDPQGVVVTPTARGASDAPHAYRLIADDDKLLRNGDTYTQCTDTREPDVWSEVDDPEGNPESDYKAAWKILTGDEM